MKQGELKSVFNKKKKFGENKFYNITYLKAKNDKEPKPFLFTDDQLSDASERATKNQEDLYNYPLECNTLFDSILFAVTLLLTGLAGGIIFSMLLSCK
jgi:hypothetical protein